MEILQFLLDFFAKEQGGNNLNQIFNLFKQNNFDIKQVIKNLTPELITPIIQAFMQQKENRPQSFEGRNLGLQPIAGFADKDIIFTLNKYFYAQTE